MGFGCVLIGASLVFGGHAHDHDHDFDADHDVDLDHDLDLDHDVDLDHDMDLHVDDALDVDHDHGAIDTIGAGSEAIWLPFLSMRFWTFASACFGLTGFLLTLGGIQEPLTGAISVGMGLTFGWTIARFFRALKTDTVSGTTQTDQLAGQEARVLLPIATDGTGKIVIQTQAGRIELMANTLDTKAITRNTRVLVISVDDGVAQVSALPHQRVEARASENLQ